MDLVAFLKEARRLRQSVVRHTKEADGQRLALMTLLLDMERQNVIWRDSYPTWTDLLKAEELCSVAGFSLFKQGVKALGAETVSKIGVSATVTLALSGGKSKVALAKEAAEKADAGASHRALSKYVRRRINEVNPRASRSAILTYAEQLRQQLVDLGLNPPPLPK